MAKLTVPQWAKSIGISKVAAYKRVRGGRVQVDEHGLVDAEEAAQQWEYSRNAIQAAKNPSGKAKVETGCAAEANDGSLAEAQRQREWLRVKQQQLELDQAEGRLVSRDEVRGAVSNMISSAKSRLLAMPDELCDSLAGESDSVRCREMLSDKMHEALTQLAEWPANG